MIPGSGDDAQHRIGMSSDVLGDCLNREIAGYSEQGGACAAYVTELVDGIPRHEELLFGLERDATASDRSPCRSCQAQSSGVPGDRDFDAGRLVCPPVHLSWYVTQ